MYTGKRFQVQEWICNQQKYFLLEILMASSSSSCNIIFDKEFRDLVFWYMCTCFMLKLENMLVNILIHLQICILINYIGISSLS